MFSALDCIWSYLFLFAYSLKQKKNNFLPHVCGVRKHSLFCVVLIVDTSMKVPKEGKGFYYKCCHVSKMNLFVVIATKSFWNHFNNGCYIWKEHKILTNLDTYNMFVTFSYQKFKGLKVSLPFQAKLKNVIQFGTFLID